MLTQVLFAVIPIAWLIIAMTLLKMSGVKACGIGLVITAAERLAVYKMGLPEVATGAAEGAIAALWPICIIIVAAMFTYNMSLHTGAMDIIKGMLGSVSNDKRIVALILGWGFSNFMEGIAGFGTAVCQVDGGHEILQPLKCRVQFLQQRSRIFHGFFTLLDENNISEPAAQFVNFPVQICSFL
jgi:L-lactate permease